MAGGSRQHESEQHRSARSGIQATSIYSDRCFPRHAHDEFGVGVLMSGAHRTWSRIGTIEAEAGQVITLNPGEMHDGAPLGDRPRGWRMLYMEPALVAAELSDEVHGDLEIGKPALWDGAARACLLRLFAEVTAVHPDERMLEEDFLRILILLFRRHGTRRAAAIEVAPSITRALELLRDRAGSDVSLRELAAASMVSRFQLLRGFARHVGATPHAYQLQLRVRAARRLLQGGCTPAQAAAEAGFADQSHMTRAFVRQLGVTPARYRAAVA